MMANFEEAFKLTFEHEGGYVDNPADKGGETIYGISRRYHPDWIGWQTVDFVKQFVTSEEGSKEFARDLTHFLKDNEVIHRQKKEFYKDFVWNIMLLNELKEQKIANAMFDAGVNHDCRDATRMAQRVANVAADGIMGSITIGAINEMSLKMFLNNFTKIRKDYYNRLVKKDPSLLIFLGGWLKRADSFDV